MILKTPDNGAVKWKKKFAIFPRIVYLYPEAT